MLLRVVKFLKDLLLASRLFTILKPFNHLFGFLYHFTKLTSWVNQYSGKFIKSDFYTPNRNYAKRPFLYKDVMDFYVLAENPVHYLEFVVASGVYFKW